MARAILAEIARDGEGSSAAIHVVCASKRAAVGVGFEDVHADRAVTGLAAVVGVRAVLADITAPVVAAVTQATEFAIAVDGVGVATAVGFVGASFSAARVVRSTSGTKTTILGFVEKRRVAVRAGVTFPGVTTIARAA